MTEQTKGGSKMILKDVIKIIEAWKTLGKRFDDIQVVGREILKLYEMTEEEIKEWRKNINEHC